MSSPGRYFRRGKLMKYIEVRDEPPISCWFGVLVLVIVFLIILLVLESLRLLFRVGDPAVLLFMACLPAVLVGADLVRFGLVGLVWGLSLGFGFSLVDLFVEESVHEKVDVGLCANGL